jgi:hypothetical protein
MRLVRYAGWFGVDNFTAGDLHYFFLSHVHTDHLHGLSNSWRKDAATKPVVFCTAVTKRWLRARYPEMNHEFVTALSLGEHKLFLTVGGERKLLEVTVLDAHHCPGSAMFLFNGFFGKVLYTGDYRIEAEVLQSRAWRDENACLLRGRIDDIVIDNTFQSNECPSRATAEALSLELVTLYPKDTLFFVGLEFGKERFASALARRLGTKLLVPEKTKREYDAMGLLEQLGECTTLSQLRDCPGDLGSGKEYMNTALAKADSLGARVVVIQRSFVHSDQLQKWINARGEGKVCGILAQGRICWLTKHFNDRTKFAYLFKKETLVELKRARDVGSTLPPLVLAPYNLHATCSEIKAFLDLVPHGAAYGFTKSSQSTLVFDGDEEESRHPDRPCPPNNMGSIDARYMLELEVLDLNPPTAPTAAAAAQRESAAVSIMKERAHHQPRRSGRPAFRHSPSDSQDQPAASEEREGPPVRGRVSAGAQGDRPGGQHGGKCGGQRGGQHGGQHGSEPGGKHGQPDAASAPAAFSPWPRAKHETALNYIKVLHQTREKRARRAAWLVAAKAQLRLYAKALGGRPHKEIVDYARAFGLHALRSRAAAAAADAAPRRARSPAAASSAAPS